LNLVAVLAAAIVIYFVGFLIYGLIFQQIWAQQTLENHGIVAVGAGAALTGEALQAELAKIPGAMDMPLAMSMGFLISLVTAIGMGLLLGLVKPPSLGAALGAGFVAWLGFAATTLAYNVVYSSESATIYGIDLMHLFIDYLAAAAVIFLIDGKRFKAAQA
jgi:hypothetical protein